MERPSKLRAVVRSARAERQPDRPGQDRHPVLAGAEVLRLVLDAEVQGGKAHAAKHSLPRLPELFEGLGASKGTPGGDHQPPPVGRRCPAPDSARQQIPTPAHAFPCGGGSDLGDDRQYPQGS